MYLSQFNSVLPGAAGLIRIKAVSCRTADLSAYDRRESLAALCREGCPDYGTNWSCPPCSPSFASHSAGLSSALLAVYYAETALFSQIPAAERVRGVNTILRLNLEKHLRALEKAHGGRMLSAGICRLCPVCSRADGSGPCRQPRQLRYSLEALGLDVAAISRDQLLLDLAWGSAAKLPEYVSAVGCLMTREPVSPDHLAYCR